MGRHESQGNLNSEPESSCVLRDLVYAKSGQPRLGTAAARYGGHGETKPITLSQCDSDTQRRLHGSVGGVTDGHVARSFGLSDE